MAEVKSPPPAPALTLSLRGCLTILTEGLAVVISITILPIVLLGAIVHWLWPWYSTPSLAGHTLDNALIALSSVAGVLWSGAIIAYSIHKKYTPPLRTGVQLLNFAILAPLAGLIGDGAALRTIFYLAAWFFVLDTAFSMTNLQMLRAGIFSIKPRAQQPNEAPADAARRAKLAGVQQVSIELFKRIAHGTRYFAFVSALCIAIFISGTQSAIAWSCLAVLVVSLFLMLPEIFNLGDTDTNSANENRD